VTVPAYQWRRSNDGRRYTMGTTVPGGQGVAHDYILLSGDYAEHQQRKDPRHHHGKHNPPYPKEKGPRRIEGLCIF